MAYPQDKENFQQGFTLIELLAVVMVAMLIGYFVYRLSNFVQGREHISDARGRMELIAAKVKQYFRTHERMPAPVGVHNDEVPVGPGILNMEEKYRLDGHGQFFRYYVATDIEGFEVDGNSAAAVLISLGPNQIRDYTEDADVVPPAYRRYRIAGDDILVPIVVDEEATDIVLRKLNVLQEKAVAYDALFASVDNNRNGEIDEDPRQATTGGSGCPPTGDFTNDPSEGLSTLDAIEKNGDYGCAAPLVDHIVLFYGLKSSVDPDTGAYIPGGYSRDPWMDDPTDPTSHRPYAWGYPGRPLDGGLTMTDQDPRCHRFYSLGPDGIDGSDDDIIYMGAN